MTREERIKEIFARVMNAHYWSPDKCDIQYTRGFPWVNQGAYLGDTLICMADTYEGGTEDWVLIAHAPSDLKFLLEEVERLNDKIFELEQQINA